MSDPTRRTVIAGATLGTLATMSRDVQAGPQMLGLRSPLAGRVAQLRDQWARGAEDLSATLLVDRPDCGDPALRSDAGTLCRGFAAVEIFKELELMPVEDQVHAPVQELFAEVFAAVGGAVRTSSAWARAWADGDGLKQDPDDQHLHGALGALRLGLRDARTTYGRQQQLETTVAAAAEDKRPGALRARVRRLLRRAEKAEALAMGIAESPGSTDVLRLDNPVVEARVAAAVAAQHRAALDGTTADGTEGAKTGGATEHPLAMVILGMICLGALFVCGLSIAVIGLCTVACDGGVQLLLLGLGLMGLAIWGAVRLGRWGLHQLRGTDETSAELRPTSLELVARVDIDAQTGWVPAGIQVHPGQPLVARAWGVVRGGRLWAADAEGDGVTAGRGAPLPGAPGRALIGRVGERVFFIGSDQRIPDGVAGPLELCANVSPDHQALMRGGFTVQLLRPVARA